MDKYAIAPDTAKKVMKWDLNITPIFDQAWQYGDITLHQNPDGSRDLQTQYGVDNLVQQLRAAVTTALNSDLLNQGYGFDGMLAIAEEQDRVMLRTRLRFGVIHVLQHDPRVYKILEVLVGEEIDPEQHPGFNQNSDMGHLPVLARFTIYSGESLSLTFGTGEGVSL